MANMTLSIPGDLYEWMVAHPEFRWSEVARQAFRKKMKEAELIEDLNAIEEGKKEFREGKFHTLEEVAKKHGFEYGLKRANKRKS